MLASCVRTTQRGCLCAIVVSGKCRFMTCAHAGAAPAQAPSREALEALRAALKAHINARWSLEAVMQGVAHAKQGEMGSDGGVGAARSTAGPSYSTVLHVAFLSCAM